MNPLTKRDVGASLMALHELGSKPGTLNFHNVHQNKCQPESLVHVFYFLPLVCSKVLRFNQNLQSFFFCHFNQNISFFLSLPLSRTLFFTLIR